MDIEIGIIESMGFLTPIRARIERGQRAELGL